MGNFASCLMAFDGFAVVSDSTDLDNSDIRLISQNIVILFHDNTNQGKSCVDKFLKAPNINTDDAYAFTEAFQTYLVNQTKKPASGFLVIGWMKKDSIYIKAMLGLHHENQFREIKSFYPVVSANTNPILTFYSQILHTDILLSHKAIELLAIAITKSVTVITPPQVQVQFQFATLTHGGFTMMNQDETTKLIDSALAFHSTVRVCCSEIF